MELVTLPDTRAVAERVARTTAELAVSARSARGAGHICLAGGSTPLHAYELLGELIADWSDLHLWYGDERCVPFDDPDSNHGAALARLHAPGATWHPMPVALGAEVGAQAYSEELAGTVLDVTLLGMGPDGHTASLFPHHPLLSATGVAAAIHDSPKPPPERITLTLPTLNASRRIVLIVTGAQKAEALGRVVAGPDPGTPASLLARAALDVLADDAAAP